MADDDDQMKKLDAWFEETFGDNYVQLKEVLGRLEPRLAEIDEQARVDAKAYMDGTKTPPPEIAKMVEAWKVDASAERQRVLREYLEADPEAPRQAGET